jgi:hypothetical protein
MTSWTRVFESDDIFVAPENGFRENDANGMPMGWDFCSNRSLPPAYQALSLQLTPKGADLAKLLVDANSGW